MPKVYNEPAAEPTPSYRDARATEAALARDLGILTQDTHGTRPIKIRPGVSQWPTLAAYSPARWMVAGPDDALELVPCLIEDRAVPGCGGVRGVRLADGTNAVDASGWEDNCRQWGTTPIPMHRWNARAGTSPAKVHVADPDTGEAIPPNTPLYKRPWMPDTDNQRQAEAANVAGLRQAIAELIADGYIPREAPIDTVRSLRDSIQARVRHYRTHGGDPDEGQVRDLARAKLELRYLDAELARRSA